MLCLFISLFACSDNNEIVLPEMNLIINDSAEDTSTDIRIFQTQRNRNRIAYAHYCVYSENETEILRIKLEKQLGMDEKTSSDFKVESDELIEVETNQALTFSFYINASNIYFYRITFYYGEHEDVLATETIYTPYEKEFYNESSFSDVAPEFHPLNSLLEKEQVFFDNCQFAVIDYAKKNHYKSISSIIGWQAKDYLYLLVEYNSGSQGAVPVCFSIKSDDTESYVAGSLGGNVIPDGEGTSEQNVLEDYFYVEKALNEALSE